MTMSASRPDFGPWASGIDAEERARRWRCLAGLALVYCGGVHPLLRLCVKAEREADAAAAASAALASLAPLTRRRLLAAYAALEALVRQ
jgi:hypothetical protein